jgi:hypothetical protein
MAELFAERYQKGLVLIVLKYSMSNRRPNISLKYTEDGQ